MKTAPAALLPPYRAACAKLEAAKDARRDAVRALRKQEVSEDDIETAVEKFGPAIDAAKAEVDATLAKMPTVAQAGITRAYGRYGVTVLKANEMIEEVGDRYGDDGRKRQAKFVVFKAPTMEEFRALRDAHYTVSLGELVSEAFQTFEDLKSELEDWHGNLPESFQDGDKGQALQEAIDSLDNACSEQEDVDERIADFTAVYLPDNGSSRSDQCAEACGKLRTVVDKAREIIESIKQGELPGGMMLDEEDERPAVENETLIELLDSLADKCEQVVSDAEGIEFPGMY